MEIKFFSQLEAVVGHNVLSKKILQLEQETVDANTQFLTELDQYLAAHPDDIEGARKRFGIKGMSESDQTKYENANRVLSGGSML